MWRGGEEKEDQKWSRMNSKEQIGLPTNSVSDFKENSGYLKWIGVSYLIYKLYKIGLNVIWCFWLLKALGNRPLEVRVTPRRISQH